MTLAIRKAIFARWNDAGLDEEIAPLYAGDRDGAPEGSTLPRAQYSLPATTERTRSRTARELIQDVRIQIWGADDSDVQQFVDLAEEAFLDAEADGTDPLVIPEGDGKVLSVDFAGKSVIQETTSVFQGILQLQIQWCRSISS
jgi:hypothetical protein